MRGVAEGSVAGGRFPAESFIGGPARKPEAPPGVNPGALQTEQTMADVQHIDSPSKIPADGNYVLVVVGTKDEIVRKDHNFTVTVNGSMPPNQFEAHLDTAIGDAKALADRERIDTVFVCKGHG
jgi:hypothetical protein